MLSASQQLHLTTIQIYFSVYAVCREFGILLLLYVDYKFIANGKET